MVRFTHAKLKGRLRELGIRQHDLAKELGMADSTLSLRISGFNYFTQLEIAKIIKALDIPREQVVDYFFVMPAEKVEENCDGRT
jgi:transcriptional regulator with XRE-family HTH domain